MIFSVAFSVLSLSVESAGTKFEVWVVYINKGHHFEYILNCLSFHCRVGSFEWNIDCDFPSHNIAWIKMDQITGVSTNFPCGEACLRNRECNYWVLNPTSHMCYLKKSSVIASVPSPEKTCGRIPNRISEWV